MQAARLRAFKEILPHENKVRIVRDDRGLGIGVWSYGNADMQNGPPSNRRTLPESLIYQRMESGVRIVSCLDGVEGQIWAGRSLVASRWWSSVPTARQWQVFLRASPDEIDDLSQPAPVHVALRTDIPLFDLDPERLAVTFSPQEIMRMAGMVGACAFLYLGAQYVRHASTLAGTERKIDKLSVSTAHILSQKRRALANMAASERFEVLGDPAMVLNGLDSLSQTLAGQDFKVKLVQVRGGEFKARVEGDIAINGPEFVAKLEASVALSKVNVVSMGEEVLIVSADLEPVEQIAQALVRDVVQP
ncbi:MAG: hypothetical protein JKY96_07310 [Phycisphaerales bacterium]|nr:hypothetical protein [Phycisphaerales bacterium]